MQLSAEECRVLTGPCATKAPAEQRQRLPFQVFNKKLKGLAEIGLGTDSEFSVD
jgi:hypothetical protein